MSEVLLGVRIARIMELGLEIPTTKSVTDRILKCLGAYFELNQENNIILYPNRKSLQCIVRTKDRSALEYTRIRKTIGLAIMKEINADELSIKLDIVHLDEIESLKILQGSDTSNLVDILYEMIEEDILRGEDDINHFKEDIYVRIKLYKDSIKSNAFKHLMYIQPKVNIKKKIYTGGELLTRLEDTETGRIVNPNVFVSVLSRYRQIQYLDALVLSKALEELRQHRGLYEGKKLAVNLSLKNFEDTSTIERILNTIMAYPDEIIKHIDLEITEYNKFSDRIIDNLKSAMKVLKPKNIGFHLDDVGAKEGYANMTLLTELEFDKVKLDKEIIDKYNSSRGLASIKALVGFCNNLGATVVAEGIEGEHQIAPLSSLGIEEMQGFLFAKPIPLENFRSMLQNGKN